MSDETERLRAQAQADAEAAVTEQTTREQQSWDVQLRQQVLAADAQEEHVAVLAGRSDVLKALASAIYMATFMGTLLAMAWVLNIVVGIFQ